MADYPPPPDPQTDLRRSRAQFRTTQTRLASLLLVAMLGSLLAWHLSDEGLNESGLYFITLPGTVAILVTLLPGNEGRTAWGVWRGATIAILASAIFIREGFICVLVALPLILPVVALIAWGTRKDKPNQLRIAVLPLVLLALGAEGAIYDFDDRIEVSETRVLDATSEQLLAALDTTTDVPELKPILFSLPFPRPTAVIGEGSQIDDYRIIRFGETGHLTIQITERTDTSITFAAVEDTSPVAGWMKFHEFTTSWQEVPDGLAYTVAIEFDRSLAPAFYFDPVQRWGVGEMAEVLIDLAEHNLVTAP